MVRFLHVSDTHLGYQAYGRLTSEGLNQREVDVQGAFQRCVDWAVEHRPDFVIHSGDLFDSPRPSNRAIAFALGQVRRLSDAGIPTVLLSGNHDAPRLRETGSIFRIFEGLPHVHPVYRGTLERIPIELAGQAVVVHAVPQAVDQASFQTELSRLAPEPGVANVLTVHGTVAGVDGLFTNELNDLLIPQNALRPEFAYIALGHFHGHRRVGDRAYYAGSTERTSIHEWDQEKGFLEVVLASEGPVVRQRSTGARPMLDLGPVDLGGMDAEAAEAALVACLERADVSDAVLRLTAMGIDRAVLRSLDVDAVRAAAAKALHFAFHPIAQDDTTSVQLPGSLGALEEELGAFLKQYPVEGLHRDVVEAEALRILAQAQEASDAS